jgi:hypothetical protein
MTVLPVPERLIAEKPSQRPRLLGAEHQLAEKQHVTEALVDRRV